MTIIDTPRLRLRPWSDADAPALFELARDPRIGTLCGWKPYESIDDAHEALSTFLAAPDSYAVTLASTGEIVGSIALRIDRDRARELSVKTMVLKYFDGNDASRRVSEKLGFTWQSREEDVEYPLIGKRLTVHRTELALAAR